MRIYIHVPFCARRCSYCDFAIAVRRDTPSAAFLEAIRTEWLLRKDHPVWKDAGPIESVYFGGGTPSRLATDALAEIMGLLASGHVVDPACEITLEANPDDVTLDRASAWSAAGINRVSLGIQSFEPRVLEWMHRTHTTEQVGPAVATLRSAGFDNLSFDLIYGLPGFLARDWEADLDRALTLDPQHLSLYALTVEAHTPLAHWRSRGVVVSAPQEDAATEFLIANQRMVAAGFEHYEVSNAAKPGFRASHNSGYWKGDRYLGLGPSAHSAWHDSHPGDGVLPLRGERHRSWNRREWEAYRHAVSEGQDPLAGTETLTDAETLLEDCYLGLRTDAGVPQHLIPSENKEVWEREGWAGHTDGRLRLTLEGWLRLDALVAQL